VTAIFITATGTDVGKTFVAASLIRNLRQIGKDVIAIKPVVSGFDPAQAGKSDPGILLDALGLPVTMDSIDLISPWRYRAPLSPDLAASMEGQRIDVDQVIAFCQSAIADNPGVVLIEGIGGIMVISQLPVILGISKPSGESPLTQLFDILQRIPTSHWPPIILGCTVIATSMVCSRYTKMVPAPLVGVLVAYGAVKLFSFHEAEVGSLPLTMPPLADFTWDARDAYTVLSAAFGLAVVSSINLLLTSRVVEHFRGRHQFLKRSDADRELGAFGIANICAGLFGAPLSVGIPARSVAAIRCGATTRLSNLLHAAFLCMFLWFGAGIVARVPLAALAGVTAWMGFNLLDWSTWHRLPRMRLIDSASFLVTMLGVLAVSNAIYAVIAGCALYGAHYLYLRFFPSPHLPTEVPAQITD